MECQPCPDCPWWTLCLKLHAAAPGPTAAATLCAGLLAVPLNNHWSNRLLCTHALQPCRPPHSKKRREGSVRVKSRAGGQQGIEARLETKAHRGVSGRSVKQKLSELVRDVEDDERF